jgi:hypothetical protein
VVSLAFFSFLLVVHGFVGEHGDKRNSPIAFKIALGSFLCLLFLSLCNVSCFLG